MLIHTLNGVFSFSPCITVWLPDLGGSRTPHLLIHYDLCKPIHSVMVALKLVWEMNSCEGQMAQTHTHTLAQNYHCEVWCGMHLTCKNTPFIPDRNGSVKRSEKYWKVTIAIARARWNGLEADPSLSTKPNRSHLDRLRKPCNTRKLKTSCLETAWFLG